MKTIISIFIGLCFASSGFADVIGEPKESQVPGWQLTDTMRLIQEFRDSHNGDLPANWSSVWNARELAWGYRRFEGSPMPHRQIAFVDAADQKTNDGTTILAISRDSVNRPLGPMKDGQRQWVKQKLVVLVGKDGRLISASVAADQPLRGVDLKQLGLKEPDPTEKQLEETAAEMLQLGFTSDHIHAALGADAVEGLKKSGVLAPALSQGSPSDKQPSPSPSSKGVTPTRNPPQSPVIENQSKSSGFPVVPTAILIAIIVAAVVVYLSSRRKH